MEILLNLVQSIWITVIALIGIWTIGFLIQAGAVLLIRYIRGREGGGSNGQRD